MHQEIKTKLLSNRAKERKICNIMIYFLGECEVGLEPVLGKEMAGISFLKLGGLEVLFTREQCASSKSSGAGCWS